MVEADSTDPNSVISAIASINSSTSGSGTVKLVDDTQSYGIIVNEGQSVGVDLNGHELSAIQDTNGNYAGSEGTKTQAMQLLKGSTVVIKDGTVTGNAGTPQTKMVIQNYSNLTLDNVIVQDAGTDRYALSNNFGEIHLKNGTQINATGDHVAFDLWYGLDKNGAYDDGVTVYIDTPDVVINGVIEFGHTSRITDEAQFLAHTHLYVCKDYDITKLTVVNSTAGSTVEYEFKYNDAIEYYELVPKGS